MKQTIEIIQKATKLKSSKIKPELEIYNFGQIQVLEHILNDNRPTEDRVDDLMRIYEGALEYCTRWRSDKEVLDEHEMVMMGASDILAWVLDIPQKVHELNKASGQLVK